MLHVYVTPVEDKKEMKSYQNLFLREFLKFKRGVPNLSHAMLISENRKTFDELLPSCNQRSLDASHQTQTKGNAKYSFCIMYT